MTKLLVLISFLVSSYSLIAQAEIEIKNKSNFSIGETITFHSSVLQEDRILNVYLPRGYQSEANKNYPVIYLLDGSADEDFIHVAGLVQFGSFSWINQIPESIVVGIANIDRKRDLTFPTTNVKDKKDFPTTGGSKNFIKFLRSEVQPLVEKTYRTGSPKTIIGQSLGGLLATEILFKSPSLFDNYIIISPSLWWDDEFLLKMTPIARSASTSIYIGVGKEGEIMERVAKELFDKLKSAEAKNPSIHFNYFEQLDHGDTLHLAVYDAFSKLFRAQ